MVCPQVNPHRLIPINPALGIRDPRGDREGVVSAQAGGSRGNGMHDAGGVPWPDHSHYPANDPAIQHNAGSGPGLQVSEGEDPIKGEESLAN